MRKLLIALLVVAFGAGVAFAADQAAAPATAAAPAAKPAAKPAKKKAAKIVSFKGTAEAVDATAGKLSVKDKDGVVKEFVIGTDVKIKRGKKVATLAEIVVGEEVMVRYADAPEGAAVKALMLKPQKVEKKAAEKKPVEKKEAGK